MYECMLNSPPYHWCLILCCGYGTADLVWFTTRQIREKCLEHNLEIWNLTTSASASASKFVCRLRRSHKGILHGELRWPQVMYWRSYGAPRSLSMWWSHFTMAWKHESSIKAPSHSHLQCVQQGCILAPTLFSITFATLIEDTFHDTDDAGIYLKFIHSFILLKSDDKAHRQTNIKHTHTHIHTHKTQKKYRKTK